MVEFSKAYKYCTPTLILAGGRVQTTWTNEGGGGVSQMTTTLNNSYLVKVSTIGGGGQNCPKFCPRGLYTAPNHI